MTWLAVVILALVTLQRIGELWLSNRNTKRLLAQGAHEVGASHYPLVVGVHALWLAALWWFAPGRPIDGLWLAIYVLLQLARIWVLATLGRRWTTRIIVVLNEQLVRRGPYRFLSHPNYLVVIGEIASQSERLSWRVSGRSAITCSVGSDVPPIIATRTSS